MELDISISSLRAVMRPVPALAPHDSIGRFVRVSRQYACSSLPVLCGNQLCGVVSEADALPLLQQESAADTETALRRPIADVMRAPEVVVRPDATPDEARRLFIRHGLDLRSSLPVADAGGYCLGIVVYGDLLIAEGPTCHPGTVGGMATPFGVYLTDGTVQAGASNWALVTSGIATGALLLIAGGMVNFGLEWLSHVTTLPHGIETMDLSELGGHVSPVVALIGLAVKGLLYLVFFGLLRASSIAGYHAAEHQTVHAMERSEPLVLDIVRRMPRPHPRCGTNIMGIGMLLFTLCPLLVNLLHLGLEDALVLAAIITLFTWRRFGTFLQAVFTTRPASDRQIASGIAAGRALLGTYYTSPPVRPSLLRRVWCMGLLQNLAGLLLVTGIVELFSWAWGHFSHH